MNPKPNSFQNTPRKRGIHMPWALVALWLLCLCGAPIVASAAQAASAVHAPETATSAPAAAAQTVVEVFVREGCPHCASTCKAEVPPEPAFEVTMLGRTMTLDDVGLPAFTIAMGLLDGLNPCSMWVLILMISLLATLNDRKRMLAIAGTFVLVEGVAYFVFMAAWLNLFLLIGMSRASQLVIAALRSLPGLINMKDFCGAGPRALAFDLRQVQARHLHAHARHPAAPQPAGGHHRVSSCWPCWCRWWSSCALRAFPALVHAHPHAAPARHRQLLRLPAALQRGLHVRRRRGAGHRRHDLSHRRLQEKEGRWLKLISGVVMVGLGVYLIAGG
jgi:cytochrome c biogenesis protein CcdA